MPQTDVTMKMRADAAADARHLMTNSKVIPKLVAVLMVSQQLFSLMQVGLTGELQEGWDIERPDLVRDALTGSAMNGGTAMTATELREAVLTTVLPVLEIFCQMENTQHVDTNTPDSVPGAHNDPAERLAEVPGGAAGNTQQQT